MQMVDMFHAEVIMEYMEETRGKGWFALNSVETSMELGQHMVKCTLEALEDMVYCHG